jgi:Lrp/AsnC family leucine-responsive transcriptional regulator
MDSNDIKALRILQKDARTSWARLAQELALTPPAAAERVRRLEDMGVIRGYAALLEPAAVGAGVTAFVAVTLTDPSHRRGFLMRVQELPEILECHHTAGEDDFVLKVRCGKTADLERLVTDEVKAITGVARTRTVVVLRTEKETVELPLPQLK